MNWTTPHPFSTPPTALLSCCLAVCCLTLPLAGCGGCRSDAESEEEAAADSEKDKEKEEPPLPDFEEPRLLVQPERRNLAVPAGRRARPLGWLGQARTLDDRHARHAGQQLRLRRGSPRRGASTLPADRWKGYICRRMSPRRGPRLCQGAVEAVGMDVLRAAGPQGQLAVHAAGGRTGGEVMSRVQAPCWHACPAVNTTWSCWPRRRSGTSIWISSTRSRRRAGMLAGPHYRVIGPRPTVRVAAGQSARVDEHRLHLLGRVPPGPARLRSAAGPHRLAALGRATRSAVRIRSTYWPRAFCRATCRPRRGMAASLSEADLEPLAKRWGAADDRSGLIAIRPWRSVKLEPHPAATSTPGFEGLLLECGRPGADSRLGLSARPARTGHLVELRSVLQRLHPPPAAPASSTLAMSWKAWAWRWPSTDAASEAQLTSHLWYLSRDAAPGPTTA